MRIGIDFDNTIVNYEGVFYEAALEKGLIPPELSTSKGAIRDYLRKVGNESAWTELQGYIYGARMDLAKPYPGINTFLNLCHQQKITVFIISHRTSIPYLGLPYNLHEAAHHWLQAQSFSHLPAAYFELTLPEKLSRIGKLNCSVFIDDLPEVLREDRFPKEVHKILFDPHFLYENTIDYDRMNTWDEISKFINLHNFDPCPTYQNQPNAAFIKRFDL